MILLLIGSGDPVIGFGRLKVFFYSTLPAHKLKRQTIVIVNVG
jgi:hypothetical protein